MRIAVIGCGHPGAVHAAARTRARIVVDGRSALDPARWCAAGFKVVGLGRPEVEAA